MAAVIEAKERVSEVQIEGLVSEVPSSVVFCCACHHTVCMA